MSQKEIFDFLIKLKTYDETDYVKVKYDLSEYLHKEFTGSDKDALYAESNRIAEEIFSAIK